MSACFGYRTSLAVVLLASGAGMTLQASFGGVSGAISTTEAITKRRAFQEPLVPMGRRPTERENAALSKALDEYLAKGDFKAITPLAAFMESHPGTPWKASLLSNLGWVYREQGYLGRAEKAWRESWNLSKFVTGVRERAVADWSAGNLADLLGRLGKREDLSILLKEAKGRTPSGTAGSLLFTATQQLTAMKQDPAHIFRCGPTALGDLAIALNRKEKLALAEDLLAGPKGTNLSQIQNCGKDMGLDLVGIHLNSAGRVPVPALLQWRAGHFATVVKEEGGSYLVRNYLAGEDKWITKEVLDEEVGSYALISRSHAMQQTGEVASGPSLSQVWGTGGTSGPDPLGPNTDQPKPKTCPAGMATYSFYATQVSLLVEDIPIWYAPPVGPAVNFHVYYNQWDLKQPQTFTFWNFGPKWTMDWLSYVTDNPASPGTGTTVYMRGGGIEEYSGYNASTGAFTPQYYHHDILVRTSATSYERRLPDGSKEVFAAPDGAVAPRRIFLTQIVDPSGNTLAFGYDTQRRLVTATDALGQVTQISYELAADPLKVTKVTDPFGRVASFQYDASNQLMQITDMGGLTSAFTYGPTPAAPTVGVDFLNALITPYGKTTFMAGVNGVDRWLQITDPLGQSERAEFHNYTGGMPASDLIVPTNCANSYFYYRNTFYWDKRAMASGAGDWTQAKIYHFMHGPAGYTSSLLESTKDPLQSRVFYGYGTGDGSGLSEVANSSRPTSTSRMLDDGTQQWTRAQYNPIGKVIKSTDALGRVTTYIYSADGLDLLEVRNTTGTGNDLLAKYTYNAQHKPLTVTDAAGQSTRFTYNASGQVQTISNPKNETTTFTYSPAQGGYLMSITGAVAGSTTNFTYDTFGRVQAVTGPDGNTITTEYDNLDRPVKVTYKDGTTEVMAYDKLDLGAKKDRQGRWTNMSYNPLRQLTEVQDAAGRSTRFDWCNCGSLQQLTDPMGHITNWWRDLQGRVIGKQLHDGTKTNYSYDSAGRLIQRVDAKGQVTNYQYFLDNNLKQVSYPNSLKLTPAVTYTYDASYNRLVSMVDGYGTTNYTYYPITTTPIQGAGRLASVTGPFANSTLSYSYDVLGRVISRGVNGSTEMRTFDALGRLDTVGNQLGTFQYAYQGATGRLDNILLPNSQKTVFTYFDSAQDYRLQGISNQKGDASVISAFNYDYNPDGSIRTWSQQADAEVPKVYSFSYDAANQLIGAALNQGGPTGTLIRQYAYGYDLAGNRTSEQIDGDVSTADYNSANQLTTQRISTSTAAVVVGNRKASGKTSVKAIVARPIKKKSVTPVLQKP